MKRDNEHYEHRSPTPERRRGLSLALETVPCERRAPRREFLHVDDLADACLHLLRRYDEPVAVDSGCGEDVTSHERAEAIARITSFAGELACDATRPDGTPSKLLDISRLVARGWRPGIALENRLASICAWLQARLAEARGMAPEGSAT